MIAKVTRDLHAREVDRVHGGEKGMTEIANRTAKRSASMANWQLFSCANWRANPPNDLRILDVCFGARLISLFTVITLIVKHSIIRIGANVRLRIVKSA